MKVVHCPYCATDFKHDIKLGRVLGAGLGVLAVKQGGGQGIVVGTASYMLGHIIDSLLVEYVDPKCPECGQVIRMAASIVAQN